MHLDRVKEILSSDQEVAVHFHGVPVWIKHIDDTSSMALISERSSHSHSQLVSIDSLAENQKDYHH